ncbi:TIGR04222 domain-containing membrane protein [Streptomyces sp. N35]|uniref:TIGR04222 domain-containing membrane protein n=1 Tax=Streptomyces sp. N35 TaxID=2795730 RepID=UPI0035ABF31B
MYDVAFLAGGTQYVVDSAVIALNRRGLLVVRSAQVRSVAGEQPLHPVERALVAFCRRPTNIDIVRAVLQRSPEAEKIGRELATWGLVEGAERQVTRAGPEGTRAAIGATTTPAPARIRMPVAVTAAGAGAVSEVPLSERPRVPRWAAALQSNTCPILWSSRLALLRPR